MSEERQLDLYLDGKVKDRPETRMFVTLTVSQIPAELLMEFGRKVVKHYEGGISIDRSIDGAIDQWTP